MRKSACILLICCCLVMFCSCKKGESNQISVADAGYVCRATLDYKDLTLSAELEVIGGGVFSIEITEPEVLSTLRFDFDNSEMAVSYHGLKSNIPLSVENMGFAELMNSAFLKLTTGSPVAVQQGDSFVLEGQSNDYDFSVLLNKQGFPVKINIPEAELSATFSDWNYK